LKEFLFPRWRILSNGSEVKIACLRMSGVVHGEPVERGVHDEKRKEVIVAVLTARVFLTESFLILNILALIPK